MQLGSKKFFGRQRSQILGYADLSLVELQEFNLLFVLGATENQAERRIFVFYPAFILIKPAKVPKRSLNWARRRI